MLTILILAEIVFIEHFLNQSEAKNQKNLGNVKNAGVQISISELDFGILLEIR